MKEKEIRKDYLLRKRTLDKIQANAEQHRFEFVMNLEPAKAEAYVGPLAVLCARWGTTMSSFGDKQFEQLVDLETLLTEDLMHNTYGTNPGFLLLSMFVTSGKNSSYHFANSLDHKVVYKGENILAMPSDLEDLYRILLALGYEQTEEERQWRDGTHPAYDHLT